MKNRKEFKETSAYHLRRFIRFVWTMQLHKSKSARGIRGDLRGFGKAAVQLPRSLTHGSLTVFVSPVIQIMVASIIEGGQYTGYTT
jgi:hypothetical protein